MVMNIEDQTCYFAEPNFKGTYSCRCLFVEVCSGNDVNCSFYKTPKKYNFDRNKAIDRCREKGLCFNCKYVDASCVKSTENKG